jgi:serine/threonine protein kinase
MIGETISHYKIVEKIGEGGMGVVYKAEDTKLDRIVALKFLPQYLTTTDTERARFLQEAKAAAALNHPNVCVIHEIQDSADEPFIVMEYVDGQTIRDVVGARHAVPLRMIKQRMNDSENHKRVQFQPLFDHSNRPSPNKSTNCEIPRVFPSGNAVFSTVSSAMTMN